MKLLTGPDGYIAFQCLACGNSHGVPTGTGPGIRWTFDGNMESPTISPSLRLMNSDGGTRCHLNVTAGQLVYHGDSPHAYAGQTVPMVDYEDPADKAPPIGDAGAITTPFSDDDNKPPAIKPTNDGPAPVPCFLCKDTGEVHEQVTPQCIETKACPACRPE